MTDNTGPGLRMPPIMAKGQVCDNCGIEPATHRMRGPTDSFKKEWVDLCNSCHVAERERLKKDRIGMCDWCGKHSKERSWMRSYEEGSSGLSYYVCADCFERQQKALADEMERYHQSLYG